MEYILLIWLGGSVLLQLIYVMASLIPNKKNNPKNSGRLHHFTVMIPAYKEDSVILESALYALSANYPKNHFNVMVLADQLKRETLDKLSLLPIQLVEVQFEKSTKVKALKKGMEQIGSKTEAIVILDADNLMDDHFLKEANQALQSGSTVIQGQRIAKSESNGLAILDAASEAINNNILCKGANKLGLSARLAGSGMVFKKEVFQEALFEMDTISGFDKTLEMKLTAKGHFLHYLPQAKVLDEKVSQGKAYSRQRGRWLAAQYQHAAGYFKSAFQGLVQGKVDHFQKWLQLLFPPRLLSPFFLMLGLGLSYLGVFHFNTVWAVFFLCNLLVFLLALPLSFWNVNFIKSLLNIPATIAQTLVALTLIPKATKEFIHTPHQLSPVPVKVKKQ
ncbi:MAG: glycosyltransferase family 2 protein [Saprospiraceae bacterium]